MFYGVLSTKSVLEKILHQLNNCHVVIAQSTEHTVFLSLKALFSFLSKIKYGAFLPGIYSRHCTAKGERMGLNTKQKKTNAECQDNGI